MPGVRKKAKEKKEAFKQIPQEIIESQILSKKQQEAAIQLPE